MWFILSASAFATPITLPLQGVLEAEQPLDGTHMVTVALTSAARLTASGSEVVWTEDVLCAFDRGRFSLALGAGGALDHTALIGWNDLRISVAVDGGTSSASVPVGRAALAVSALHAADAERLGGLPPSAYQVLPGDGLRFVGTTLSVDHSALQPDWGSVSGRPEPLLPGTGLDLVGGAFDVDLSEVSAHTTLQASVSSLTPRVTTLESQAGGRLAELSFTNPSNVPTLTIIAGYRSVRNRRVAIPAATITGGLTSPGWFDRSEATEPASGAKIVYIYANVSDTSKFAVSNSAPSDGNLRTIGGVEYVYLGAGRYSSTNGVSPSWFAARSVRDEMHYLGGIRYILMSDGQGLERFRTSNICNEVQNINLSVDLPGTVDLVWVGYGTTSKIRCDSPCLSTVTQEVTAVTQGRSLDREVRTYHVSTPYGGSYFPIPHGVREVVEIPASIYDLSAIRFEYSAGTCYADGHSGHAGGIVKYRDGQIY
jgi:hypothetical protein